MEALKAENQALMEELVVKKMALAELSEMHAKLKRDLHRQAQRDKVRLLFFRAWQRVRQKTHRFGV